MSILALPSVEQREVFLIAVDDVFNNDTAIERDTAKQRLDLVKITSVEYSLAAKVARTIRWDEAATLFDDGAAIFARVVRGELRGDAADAEARAWTARFAILRNAAVDQFKQANLGIPMSVVANDARSNVAAFIGGGARLAVWSERPKDSTAKPSAATRRAIAASRVELRVRMFQARDVLVRLPMPEQSMALLDAGGSINVLIQAEAKDTKGRGNAKQQTFWRTSANAVDQLADLARQMGFAAIARCHQQESVQMRSLARGIPAAPADCRRKVYPASWQAAAVQVGNSERGSAINGLVDTWAIAAWNYSRASHDNNATEDNGA